MATIDPGKLRPGMRIVCDKLLYTVVDFNLRTPGNLRSFVVCKLRGFADGRVTEKTFRGGADHPEDADFEQRTSQFLYNDDMGYHFMDTKTFEQLTLPTESLGFQAKMLAGDMEVIMSYWNGKPVGVELPPKMVFLVKDTMETIAKGNSSGNVTKDATLETGLVIQVPAFVKTGDKVRVSTEDGKYVERA
ncbi:elongation factor P [soil metagenome]